MPHLGRNLARFIAKSDIEKAMLTFYAWLTAEKIDRIAWAVQPVE
jgi:hypothetical protein